MEKVKKMSTFPSKLKKAFTAAASELKKDVVGGLIATSMTSTLAGLFIVATGGSLAGAALPVIATAATVVYGPNVIKAAYRAYKQG